MKNSDMTSRFKQCIFKVKMWEATSRWGTSFWLEASKTNAAPIIKCLRAAITTQDLLVMRYKMSSDISSAFPCLRFLLPVHFLYPLFILQSSGTLFSFSAVISFSHSFHPEHFPFSHPFFHLLPIPPTSLLPPLHPSLPPSLSFGHFS